MTTEPLGGVNRDAEGVRPAPIPMLLWCPGCRERHVDQGEFAQRAHHTHACQSCGMVWRPALVSTVGVQFLPGFSDREDADGTSIATKASDGGTTITVTGRWTPAWLPPGPGPR